MSDLKYTALRHRMLRAVATWRTERPKDGFKYWPKTKWDDYDTYTDGRDELTGAEKRALRQLHGSLLIDGDTENGARSELSQFLDATDLGLVVLAEWDAAHPEVAAEVEK